MKKIFVAALLLSAAFAWWFGDGPVLRNQLGIQQGKAAPAPAVVTYTVVLSAANPENLLLPGMTALVRITVNRTGPVVKVPLAALRYSPKPEQRSAAEQGEVVRGRPASVWIAGENGDAKGVAVGLGDDDAT